MSGDEPPASAGLAAVLRPRRRRVLIEGNDGSRLRHERPPLYAALRWAVTGTNVPRDAAKPRSSFHMVWYKQPALSSLSSRLCAARLCPSESEMDRRTFFRT